MCKFAHPSGSLRYPIRQTNFMASFFSIPHRPTKLLIEPAACKSLKINKVASRALASLLITERGNGGNRAGKRAAQDATLATSLRFSLGNRQKKSQLIRVGTLSIGGGTRNRTRVRFPKRIAIEPASVRVFGLLSFFPREPYLLKGEASLGWRARKQSPSRSRVRFRISQFNWRPQFRKIYG